jgi:hypothetical protein
VEGDIIETLAQNANALRSLVYKLAAHFIIQSDHITYK